MKKEFEENAFDLNGDGVMDEQELLAESFVIDEEEQEEEKEARKHR